MRDTRSRERREGEERAKRGWQGGKERMQVEEKGKLEGIGWEIE